MTRMLLLSALLASGSALAQYSGPAVDTCLNYAKAELTREGNRMKGVVIERDASLLIERYTRKVGNQFVSSILTGNAAIVLDGSPSSEMSFVCLLADDKRAVFFEWMPRANPSAIMQCTRDSGLRAKPHTCLQTLLQAAENDLMQGYANGLHEARERDTKAGNEAAITAYRKSNDQWREYRDAECARRRDYAPKGISADDFQLACQIDLTRRRGLDMR